MITTRFSIAVFSMVVLFISIGVDIATRHPPRFVGVALVTTMIGVYVGTTEMLSSVRNRRYGLAATIVLLLAIFLIIDFLVWDYVWKTVEHAKRGHR